MFYIAPDPIDYISSQGVFFPSRPNSHTNPAKK